MNLRETAERIVKDLNLDARTDIDYLEIALQRVAQEAVDYETEQGYYSTVIADAELEAKAEAKKEVLEEIKALSKQYLVNDINSLAAWGKALDDYLGLPL